VLPRAFYNRDPREVGPDLLGKLLLRRWHGEVLAGRIVEAEAYLGADDPAAHAAVGRTARNAVLFGPPGHAYVYFIYGNHWCLNVSCMEPGEAGSLLLRALEPVAGLRTMARLRGMSFVDDQRTLRMLTSGPGRLCQALAITRERINGKDVTSPRSGLWIADNGGPRPEVTVSKRIGITKAAEQPFRYTITGNPFVSR
jgi:DNA-3-methyladenine glycosylase